MGASLKDRKHDVFDWLENPDYLAYREQYVRYIQKHEHELEVYTNLDIVNNAEATWDNQQYFESFGLKPLPVWHFGSDIKWLKHYLRKGYDYIGIGGLVPNPYAILQPALDDIFTKYLCDTDGTPLVKVHGFAATSVPLMCRYPFYSVDSASWIKYAAFGGIMVPQKVKGEYRYLLIPHKIKVSGKSPERRKEGLHIKTVRPLTREYILKYIEEKGFKLGKSKFRKGQEVRIEDGLCNRPYQRCLLNTLYYIGLRNQLPEWPWKFTATRGHSLWT
jgi:hypothetical protein